MTDGSGPVRASCLLEPLSQLVAACEEESVGLRRMYRLFNIVEFIVTWHAILCVKAEVDAGPSDKLKAALANGKLANATLGSWRELITLARRTLEARNACDGWALRDPCWDAAVQRLITLRNTYAHVGTPSEERCQADFRAHWPDVEQILALPLLAVPTFAGIDGGEGVVSLGRAHEGSYPRPDSAHVVVVCPGGRSLDLWPLATHSEGRLLLHSRLDERKRRLEQSDVRAGERVDRSELLRALLERFPLADWREAGGDELADFRAFVRAACAGFEGRRAELARLHDFALQGRGTHVLWGPAGIGKSALVAQLVDEQRAGRTRDGEELPGDRPHVIEYYANGQSEVGFLQHVASSLASAFGCTPPLAPNERTAAALRQRLETLDEYPPRGVLIVVDGLDERPSLAAEIPRPRPWLRILVTSRRTPETEAFHLGLHAAERSAEELGPIDLQTVRALLLQAVAGFDDRVDDAYVSAVCERSQGHPLYVTLLGNELRIRAVEAGQIERLPSELNGLVKGVLKRVQEQGGQQAYEILALLATASEPVPASVIVEVLGESAPSVDRHLLAAGELLSVLGEAAAPRYRLLHARIEEYLRLTDPPALRSAHQSWASTCTRWRDVAGHAARAYALRHACRHLFLVAGPRLETPAGSASSNSAPVDLSALRRVALDPAFLDAADAVDDRPLLERLGHALRAFLRVDDLETVRELVDLVQRRADRVHLSDAALERLAAEKPATLLQHLRTTAVSERLQTALSHLARLPDGAARAEIVRFLNPPTDLRYQPSYDGLVAAALSFVGDRLSPAQIRQCLVARDGGGPTAVAFARLLDPGLGWSRPRQLAVLEEICDWSPVDVETITYLRWGWVVPLLRTEPDLMRRWGDRLRAVTRLPLLERVCPPTAHEALARALAEPSYRIGWLEVWGRLTDLSAPWPTGQRVVELSLALRAREPAGFLASDQAASPSGAGVLGWVVVATRIAFVSCMQVAALGSALAITVGGTAVGVQLVLLSVVVTFAGCLLAVASPSAGALLSKNQSVPRELIYVTLSMIAVAGVVFVGILAVLEVESGGDGFLFLAGMALLVLFVGSVDTVTEVLFDWVDHKRVPGSHWRNVMAPLSLVLLLTSYSACQDFWAVSVLGSGMLLGWALSHRFALEHAIWRRARGACGHEVAAARWTKTHRVASAVLADVSVDEMAAAEPAEKTTETPNERNGDRGATWGAGCSPSPLRFVTPSWLLLPFIGLLTWFAAISWTRSDVWPVDWIATVLVVALWLLWIIRSPSLIAGLVLRWLGAPGRAVTWLLARRIECLAWLTPVWVLEADLSLLGGLEAVNGLVSERTDRPVARPLATSAAAQYSGRRRAAMTYQGLGHALQAHGRSLARRLGPAHLLERLDRIVEAAGVQEEAYVLVEPLLAALAGHSLDAQVVVVRAAPLRDAVAALGVRAAEASPEEVSSAFASIVSPALRVRLWEQLAQGGQRRGLAPRLRECLLDDAEALGETLPRSRAWRRRMLRGALLATWRAVVVGTLLFGLGALLPLVVKHRRAKLLAEGRRLEGKGNNEGALRAYTVGIELFRTPNRELLLARGHLRARSEDEEGAEADLTAAITLLPAGSPVPWTDLDRADLTRALRERARLRAVRGDHRRALEDLDRALVVCPEDGSLWRTRGALRTDVRDPLGAAADYEAATARGFDDAATWALVAFSLDDAGEPARARAAAARGLQLRPGDMALRRLRARAHVELGDDSAAEAEWTELLARGDGVETFDWLYRAHVRLRRGDKDGAVADANTALDLGPTDARVWFGLARIRAHLGDLESAIEALDQAVRLAPDLFYARLWRALLGGSKDGLEADGWCGALAAYALGRTAPEALVALASAVAGEERRQRLCEAHGYLGLTADLAGDEQAARAHYEACVAQEVHDFVEDEWARLRLVRPGVPLRR